MGYGTAFNCTRAEVRLPYPVSLYKGMPSPRVAEVKRLQRLLNLARTGNFIRAMGPALVVDGNFGNVTKYAVIAFQNTWINQYKTWMFPRGHAYADGVAGPKTISWLKWHVCKTFPDSAVLFP